MAAGCKASAANESAGSLIFGCERPNQPTGLGARGSLRPKPLVDYRNLPGCAEVRHNFGTHQRIVREFDKKQSVGSTLFGGKFGYAADSASQSPFEDRFKPLTPHGSNPRLAAQQAQSLVPNATAVPAGAPREKLSFDRERASLDPADDRRQRAPCDDPWRNFDEYMAVSDDYKFGRLHATLGMFQIGSRRIRSRMGNVPREPPGIITELISTHHRSVFFAIRSARAIIIVALVSTSVCFTIR